MSARLKILFLSLLLVTACQSPFLVFAGKALVGEETSTKSFAFASEYSLLQLETHVDEPYSVILRCTVIEGQLYIDAAPRRRWGKNLAQSNAVRVKLGNKIYPALASEVTDASLTRLFLSGRKLYRLDPVTKKPELR